MNLIGVIFKEVRPIISLKNEGLVDVFTGV